MIKIIYATAASMLIAAAVALAPSYVSSVEASEPAVVSQHDKVEIRQEANSSLKCSEQAWPNIDAACLRTTDNKTVTRPVRVISMNRG